MNMESLQSLLGAMAATSGNPEDLSEAEAEMKLALEEACQEAGVTLSPGMSPKALCIYDYRENMPGVGKVAGWLRSTRRLRKMPAFQRLASQRRCKSAEDLPRMQAISEEEILGQAAGVPGRLPSRLHRGNSEPETGRAELGADLEEGEPDENMDERVHPLSPLSPSNILERLGSARELDISSGHLAWPGLAAVYRTEHADDPSDSAGSDGVMEIKINSGGVVYFAVFQYPKPPREQGEAASGAPRRASLGGPVQQHVSQMAVTTSQEGPAVVVRAYGSQGMTQLSFPSPTNAQRVGAGAPPSETLDGDQAVRSGLPASGANPAPASPPLSPAQHGSCGPAVPASASDAERAEGEAHGLKLRVGPRMLPDGGGAGSRPDETGGMNLLATDVRAHAEPPNRWRRSTMSARPPRVEMEEFAACIKFAPSRLATQSERLGSELARHLGVPTPQARVIHSGSEEWAAIQAAVEKAKERAVDKIQVLAANGSAQSPAYKAAEDEERTCDELLDALRIFRCLLLMGYVHGKSLKDSPTAFAGAAEQEATARALGRVLVLDLLLRNEDRLAITRLGWHENAGNLRYTERPFITTRTPAQHAAQTAAVADAALKVIRKAEGGVKGRAKAGSAGSKPRVATILEAEGLSLTGGALHKRSVSAPNVREIQEATRVDPIHAPTTRSAARGSVVVIDSGIPRRPPAAKMEADRENFPKIMELLLCDADVAAEILREISSGHLLRPPENTAEGETTPPEAHRPDPHSAPAPPLASSSSPPAASLHPPKPPVSPASVAPAASLGSPEQSAERRLVEAFQRGVREGLEAVHLLRPLLSRLHQRLDALLRAFIACIGEVGKADLRPSPPAHRRLSGAGRTPSPDSRKSPSFKEVRKPPSPRDTKLPPPPAALRTAGRGGSASPGSDGREPGSPLRGSPLRFTIRLKDWQKVAKVDDEVSDMLGEWDAKLREEASAICEAHGFVTGFLEWGGGHSLVDSYELKVRLEHVLERIGLVLAGAEAQRPSQILPHLFVGGVASARSCHVLQHLGITHVVNMAPEDTLGEDGRLGEFPNCFKYTHCQARDTQTEDIGRFFEPVSDLINEAAAGGGKVLVHCFEGKSRSVAVVLAYLMLHKAKNLAQAWAAVKLAHPRAAPNDGFAQALMRLDKQLHGQVASMEWKGKKPMARLCPICGKNAGLSTDSLRVHFRKVHPEHKMGPLPPLAG